MNKKLFAMLLALVMVFSMMSVMAFAEEDCNHHDSSKWTYVDLKDGTHAAFCCDKQVPNSTSPHWFENGVCIVCDAKEPAPAPVCNHIFDKYDYVSNGDKTHNTVCPNDECKAVIFKGAPCHFENGVCVACNAKCYHNGNNFEYVFDGDKDHRTHKTVCKDCHMVIAEGVECAVENNKCVGCGTVFASSLTPATPVEKCNHIFDKYDYVSNGDKTHNTVCPNEKCKAVIFEGAPCYFENGVCVACGAVCYHNGNNFEYVFDGDKDHRTHKTVCKDCGATIAEGAECYLENNKCVACGTVYATGLFPATPVKCYHNGNNYEYVNEGGHTHSTVCKDCGETIFTGAACYFENGVCVACGASEKCYHAGNNYKYVSNKDNTHNTVCLDCGETIFKGADCYFENGVCVACGAKPVEHHMPWHPHHHHTTVNGVPQTGDEANMTLWIGIVVAASAVMAAAYVGLKKTR